MGYRRIAANPSFIVIGALGRLYIVLRQVFSRGPPVAGLLSGAGDHDDDDGLQHSGQLVPHSHRAGTALAAGTARGARMSLIEMQGLCVSFRSRGREVRVLNDISFAMEPGGIGGIPGESGSGKSVTAAAIMRPIDTPSGRIETGRILFQRCDVLALPRARHRAHCGAAMAMAIHPARCRRLRTAGSARAAGRPRTIAQPKVRNRWRARGRTIPALACTSDTQGMGPLPRRMAASFRWVSLLLRRPTVDCVPMPTNIKAGLHCRNGLTGMNIQTRGGARLQLRDGVQHPIIRDSAGNAGRPLHSPHQPYGRPSASARCRQPRRHRPPRPHFHQRAECGGKAGQIVGGHRRSEAGDATVGQEMGALQGLVTGKGLIGMGPCWAPGSYGFVKQGQPGQAGKLMRRPLRPGAVSSGACALWLTCTSRRARSAAWLSNASTPNSSACN